MWRTSTPSTHACSTAGVDSSPLDGSRARDALVDFHTGCDAWRSRRATRSYWSWGRRLLWWNLRYVKNNNTEEETDLQWKTLAPGHFESVLTAAELQRRPKLDIDATPSEPRCDSEGAPRFVVLVLGEGELDDSTEGVFADAAEAVADALRELGVSRVSVVYCADARLCKAPRDAPFFHRGARSAPLGALPFRRSRRVKDAVRDAGLAGPRFVGAVQFRDTDGPDTFTRDLPAVGPQEAPLGLLVGVGAEARAVENRREARPARVV